MKYPFIALLLLLAAPSQIQAQNSPWEAWDSVLIGGLHTAEGADYLTENEQKLILFMNMARYDGSLFAETFVKSYVEAGMAENSSFLRSLNRDLKNTSKLPLLYPEKDLTAVAQGHAVQSGQSGHVGHRNINKRFEHLKGNPYMAWGENCAYGYQDAVDIVITLLIDEGIKGEGHRKNILKPGFNSVGVAIRPHKNYEVNCVMDFGSKSPSDMNKLPY